MIQKRRLRQLFDAFLACAVIFSAFILVIGGVLFLLKNGNRVPDYHIFHGTPIELHGISGVITMIYEGESEGVIQAGLFLLMLVPLLRVFFFMIYYTVKKYYIYTFLSLFTLMVLLFSMFWNY